MDILHALFATTALLLGGFQLMRRKGNRPHRLIGRAYFTLMALTALSSFFLHSMTGGFSFLHLLSILTLVTLVQNVIYMRRGDVVGHACSMIYLYGGLLTAGLFAAARHGLDMGTAVLVSATVMLWIGVIALAEKVRRGLTVRTAQP